MVSKQFLVLSIGIFFTTSYVCAMQRHKKRPLALVQQKLKKQKQIKQSSQTSLLLQQPKVIIDYILSYLPIIKPSLDKSEKSQRFGDSGKREDRVLCRLKLVSKSFNEYPMAPVSSRIPLTQTLLHEAVIDNDISTIYMCRKNQESLNVRDRFGCLPVHYLKSKQAAQIIIPEMNKKDINVNVQDYDGNTVLHNAFRRGNQLHLITYLTKKINGKIKNNNGETAVECMDTEWVASEISEFYT